MPVVRISITIPAALVKQADAEAKRCNRSRSWVIAEATRRYLEAVRPGRAVREPATPVYAPGLGEQRRAQLRADMRLTPEARVKEAERTAREGETSATARASYGRTTRLIGFERYEDYLDYKRREDAR